MTTLSATKKATEIQGNSAPFKIDFSKKNISNSVLALISGHQKLSFWLRHPLLKADMQTAWQHRAAQALNTLSNHKLNEQALLKTLQHTEGLAQNFCQEAGQAHAKPLISTAWLLDLQEQILVKNNIGETPRYYRDKQQTLSYLNRLSGVAAIDESNNLPKLIKQWRDWANSKTVMHCAAEYRALMLLYYLQRTHPFAQSQTAVSFTMFYGLLKSAGFAQVADAVLVYYAENIESFATVFAATTNSEHLKNHQQKWFEFFLDAWQWSMDAVQASLDKVLLESNYQACMQKSVDSKQINQRQHTTLMHLLVSDQIRDKQSLIASGWYRSLYNKLTVRTQERDFKSLCELGFIEMLGKNSFKLTSA